MRAPGPALPLFVLLLLPACATSPGDTLYARGHYESAAEAYQADLNAKPGDPELLRKQEHARQAALEQLAERARAARLAGDVEGARSWEADLLRAFKGWGEQPPSARPLVEEAARQLRAVVEEEIAAHLQRGAPGRALTTLNRARPEGALFWSDAELRAHDETIRAAGAARCGRAKQRRTPRGPFTQHVLARYCAAFGVEAGALPKLPGLYGRAYVDAKMPGVESEDLRPLEIELPKAFSDSPWFDAASPHQFRIVTGGELQEIRLTVVAHSDGRGGFHYTRVLSPHRVPLQGPVAGTPVGYTARLFARTKEPIERETRIEPTTIRTEHELEGRRSVREGLAREARRLRDRLDTLLVTAWHDAHCTPAAPDVEAAARCLYGDPEAEGQHAFAQVFGEDATELLDAVVVHDGAVN